MSILEDPTDRLVAAALAILWLLAVVAVLTRPRRRPTLTEPRSAVTNLRPRPYDWAEQDSDLH